MAVSENHKQLFRFKRFALSDKSCAMKIGTDGLLLGAWAGQDMTPCKVVDIGAGCGIVGLMLAQRFGRADVHFIEIDGNASVDLKYNVNNSPWRDRCSVSTADYKDIEIKDIDLIASNPPYFITGELPGDEARATARHAAGLSPETLLDYAAGRLTSRGRVSMIIPADQLADIESHAAFLRLNPSRVCLVSTVEGKDPIRALVEFTHAAVERSEERLVVRDRKGNFTPVYRALTGNFHINI